MHCKLRQIYKCLPSVHISKETAQRFVISARLNTGILNYNLLTLDLDLGFHRKTFVPCLYWHALAKQDPKNGNLSNATTGYTVNICKLKMNCNKKYLDTIVEIPGFHIAPLQIRKQK